MGDLPFSVSPEAEAFIAETLGLATPDFAGLLPALGHCYNYTSAHPDGRVFEHFADDFWQIGYYKPQAVTDHGFVPVSLCGRTVWMHPNSLRDLTGKRLVVETVAVGFPNPADKTARLLRTA